MNSKQLLMLMSLSSLIPDSVPKEGKHPKKCQLPECEIMTIHNGGYCCSEHCLEHRKRIKEEFRGTE